MKKNSKSLTNSDPYGVSSHLGQECSSNHPYPDKRTDGSWQTSPPGVRCRQASTAVRAAARTKNGLELFPGGPIGRPGGPVRWRRAARHRWCIFCSGAGAADCPAHRRRRVGSNDAQGTSRD